ncbi:MAG: DUF6361 family protein [Bryobacterales bacterium]|nr:DUF6361 family protein [Bryobacterales bacterium]
MSSLTWVDFDESERQRARRIIDLFQETSARDELGLGPIRDSIADHLFPGTSTVQTRLRYMLFVPWIYREIEEKPGLSPDALLAEARSREDRLISALEAGGETAGVIGRMAKERLQTPPRSIYWSGLGSWGLRQGSMDVREWLAWLQGAGRSGQLHGAPDDSGGAEQPRMWRADLPRRPPGLLDRVTFRLTADEAGYLVDRITAAHPQSLLAHLAKRRLHADCDFVWRHPGLPGFPEQSRFIVGQAKSFSAAMQGAALLYNLMLAEERENSDWETGYRTQLAKWSRVLNEDIPPDWDLRDFWEAIRHDSHRIREPAKQFVARWRALAMEHGENIADSKAARELVRSREVQLKGNSSRFQNTVARDNWGGSSGAGRLDFRWPVARRHIRDVADAG